MFNDAYLIASNKMIIGREVINTCTVKNVPKLMQKQ